MYNFELQQDIKAQIEKHLPSATSGALREHLDECERIKEENENLKTDIKKFKNRNEQLTKDIQALECFKNYEAKLDAREEELAKREENIQIQQRDLDRRLLEKELEMTKDKQKAFENMLNTVFRNQQVQKSIYSDHTHVVKDAYNNQEMIQSHPVSKTVSTQLT